MSLLKELRALMPARPLSHIEARWVAERQASLLRERTRLSDEPFLPREVIERLPKINVSFDATLPESGATHWTGSSWQITVNAGEPFARQRYTLAHELKHIIDAPFDDFCYPGGNGVSAEQRAENICDYFAACLLMPKMIVRRAWTSGGTGQNIAELAHLFGVSTVAMEVRLQELGLLESRYRCRTAPPISPAGRRYLRVRRETWRAVQTGGRGAVTMVGAPAGGAA